MLQWMRDKLSSHVHSKVDPPVERKAMDAAYKKVAPLVSKVVQAKFKPADMKVLAKYKVAQPDKCIRLTLSDMRVVEFKFRSDEDAPLAPRTNCYDRMFLGDEALTAAFDAYMKAKDAHDDETKKRLCAYASLIRNSSTVEDIIEVWPEAAALLPATEIMAPLSPEQLAIIKADADQRLAA
jgi:hypothetical protein